METMKFKTNMRCSGCLDRVGEILKSDSRIHSWEVGKDQWEKLSIVSENISESEIIGLIKKAGYSACRTE